MTFLAEDIVAANEEGLRPVVANLLRQGFPRVKERDIVIEVVEEQEPQVEALHMVCEIFRYCPF